MISLHVIQLAKSFGTKSVFSDVTFEHQKNTLGIAGPNGSGKSTFLKCLGNLLRPTSGTIEWKKNNQVLTQGQFQQILGYAAPYINLYDELSCRENLAFLTKIRHEGNYDSSIEEWLRKTGLKHVADQPFGKLSTGQQQRLRLTSALFHGPEVLLLDEPGSNLDEAGRALITEIAEQFTSSQKILILASNDPAELNLCERVFSIEDEVFSDVEIDE
jgi:ABC-type multidrug transport system ATPase subunit